MEDRNGERPPAAPREPAPAPEPEGGDPVCWLESVCPQCGRIPDTPHPAACPCCGTPRES